MADEGDSLFFVPQLRERYVVSYCQESDKANDDKGSDDREIHTDTQTCHTPIGQSTQHTCHGVDFLSENHRFLIQQDISDDTTCGSCDATHDDGNPKRETTIQRFLNTCYIE